MVSIWWVVLALFGGTLAGVLVMALMQMAGALEEQSSNAPDLHEMPR